MATTAAPDTVWVGFMDVVPVIGTVKEGVEWILAVYENNKEIVKEKEQQIKGSLQPQKSEMEKLKEGIEELKLTKTPKASQEEGPGKPEMSEASALEFAGLQNIREINENEILKYVRSCSGGKRGKVKMSEKEKKERERKYEKIVRDVKDKLLLLKPDGRLAWELVIEMQGHERGEHVFNNDILKFHSNVLEQFKNQYGIQSDQPYRNIRLTDLDGHTLSDNIKDEIMTNMIASFQDTEFYVNANAVLYGLYARELGNALRDVLDCVYTEKVSEEKRKRVNHIIYLMNKHEIYVDYLAKEKWTNNGRRRMERFRLVKDKVVKMYKEERGYEWCIKILKQICLLFETL